MPNRRLKHSDVVANFVQKTELAESRIVVDYLAHMNQQPSLDEEFS